MSIRPLTPDFAVAPQIDAATVTAAAAEGYAILICNRPDGEEPGQPDFADLAAAAEAAGMTARHIPVSSGGLTQEAVAATQAAMASGRALAQCRTGTRSCFLWAAASAGTTPAGEIIATGAAQGYDLSPMRAFLERD